MYANTCLINFVVMHIISQIFVLSYKQTRKYHWITSTSVCSDPFDQKLKIAKDALKGISYFEALRKECFSGEKSLLGDVCERGNASFCGICPGINNKIVLNTIEWALIHPLQWVLDLSVWIYAIK